MTYGVLDFASPHVTFLCTGEKDGKNEKKRKT